MAPEGRVFVTGPDVVQRHRRSCRHLESSGGPDTHHKKSGCTHIVARRRGRRLRTRPSPGRIVLPAGGISTAEGREAGDSRPACSSSRVCAARLRRASAGRGSARIPRRMVRRPSRIQAKWAPSIVVGLGRLSGRTVGVLANNPLRLGGCLTLRAPRRRARLVRLYATLRHSSGL